MVDGTDVPVQVSFNVTNVQEGESAYKTLISGNAEIPKAENGMEYVVVTLNVTYDSGTPDNLYIMEDYASLDSAKMYFALSNGDSNAEQFTKHLSDSIYNLTVEKGKSAQGSVAFLRKIGSNEPLYFVGYGKPLSLILQRLIGVNHQWILHSQAAENAIRPFAVGRKTGCSVIL